MRTNRLVVCPASAEQSFAAREPRFAAAGKLISIVAGKPPHIPAEAQKAFEK
jgi:hypothetical protein